MEDRIKHMKTECGIFAVLGHPQIPPVVINQGMRNIQHRGQDSYGLSARDSDGRISEIKEFGLLPDELFCSSPSIAINLLMTKVIISFLRFFLKGMSFNVLPFNLYFFCVIV